MTSLSQQLKDISAEERAAAIAEQEALLAEAHKHAAEEFPYSDSPAVLTNTYREIFIRGWVARGIIKPAECERDHSAEDAPTLTVAPSARPYSIDLCGND